MSHQLVIHTSDSLKTNVAAEVNEQSGDKGRIYTF